MKLLLSEKTCETEINVQLFNLHNCFQVQLGYYVILLHYPSLKQEVSIVNLN